MMKTKIVPKEDMEIIKKYISTNNAIVLIDESVLDELSEKQAAYVRKNDGRFANYGFGGEADALVDLVTTPDHYFFTGFLFPEEEE